MRGFLLTMILSQGIGAISAQAAETRRSVAAKVTAPKVTAEKQVVAEKQTAWKENLKEIHAQALTKAHETHAAQTSAGHKALGTVHAASVATKTYTGSPYTIENLIARVETNAKRFSAYHGTHTTVILERDIQIRAMIAQGKCPTLGGIYNGGLLAQTPYHRYLEYRRSLNPAKFDECHPVLGPIIGEDARIRAYTMACAAEMLTPPGGSSGSGSSSGTPGGENGSGGGTGTSGGGTGNPTTSPAVPAPAGLILMAIGSTTLVLRKGVSSLRRSRVA